jgi:hypothetical protein
MEGRCDCGGVTITVPGLPETVNACPCAFCRRVGGLWGYYPRAAVSATGETHVYRRASRVIEFHRCAVCGVLTHWIEPEGFLPHMGVHMKNFDPAIIADVPVVVEP